MLGIIKRFFGSEQELIREDSHAKAFETTKAEPQFRELSPEEVKAKVTAGTATILDVRTREEHAQRHIKDSTLIPLQELEFRYDQLDSSKEYVVVCEHGIRSADAAAFLSSKGFKNVATLKDGLADYTGETVKKEPSPFQVYQEPSEPAMGGGCCSSSGPSHDHSAQEDKPSGGGCACCG